MGITAMARDAVQKLKKALWNMLVLCEDLAFSSADAFRQRATCIEVTEFGRAFCMCWHLWTRGALNEAAMICGLCVGASLPLALWLSAIWNLEMKYSFLLCTQKPSTGHYLRVLSERRAARRAWEMTAVELHDSVWWSALGLTNTITFRYFLWS